jgi:hypothetical protein
MEAKFRKAWRYVKSILQFNFLLTMEIIVESIPTIPVKIISNGAMVPFS